MAGTKRDQALADLLEACYPGVAAMGLGRGGSSELLRGIPDLGRARPIEPEVRLVVESWVIRVVPSSQAALGIPSGGTSFGVVDRETGAPVTIDQDAAGPYLNALVLFTGGPSRGRRSIITDVRRANSTTYVTVKDSLTLTRGDTLDVLTPGLSGAASISAATLGSVTTMQDAATAEGLGTALPVSGYGVATVALSGTFSATITWKGVGPDGNTYTIEARQRGAGTAPSSTATATGLYEIDTLNLTSVYADITTYTSGSVTAKGSAQPLAAPASQMSLTGSLAPLVAAAPTTALTVPYTSFVASATIYPKAAGALHRNARHRTFVVQNTLNENLSAAAAMTFYDSTLGFLSNNSEGETITLADITEDASGTWSDGKTPGLAANVDSFFASLAMGATLPTSGAVTFYAVEVF